MFIKKPVKIYVKVKRIVFKIFKNKLSVLFDLAANTIWFGF